MALNFPASPLDGDVYENYVWNATVGAWQSQFTGGGGSIEVSSTAPTSPSAGDLWWDPDNGNLYIYYDDGTTQQWVAANGPQVVVSTSAPAGYQGQLWFDSVTGKTYIYYDDGTTGQWVSAIGGSLSGNVIQVVNFRASTQVTTTSTSYVTSGLEATITPSSASNKIVILCTTGVEVANRTNAGEFALFRGGVAGTLLDMASVYPSSTSWINLNIAINHVDSPATTSPTTYTLGFKNSTDTSTTTYVNRYGKGNIILMEVAG